MDPEDLETAPVEPVLSDAPAVEAPVVPALPQKPQGNQRIVTVKALQTQVRAAEAQATARAKAAQDKQAQELGYRNHEDMILKLKNRKAARPSGARPTPAATAAAPGTEPGTDAEPADLAQTPRQARRTEVENQRLTEKLAAATRARNSAEKKNRDFQRKLDEKDAELGLRSAAIRAGVQDVDYAIHLVRKHMATMAEGDFAGFDEEKYFSKDLRNKYPHLYATEVQPAHTDPATSSSPGAPPAPGAKPPVLEEKASSDVRKLSQQEFNESLRKRGLTPPGLGLAG